MAYSDCVNCSSSCFELTKDDCVETTVNSEELGIEAGEDSLKSTLDKIINEVECLKENECDPCNKCKNSGGTSSSESDLGLITTSTNKPKTVTGVSPMSLKVIPGTSNTSVEYNMISAISAEGCKSAIVKVEAYGSSGGVQGRIHSSKSQSGSFSASPENFPMTFTIDVTCLESSGQKNLKFAKTLLNVKSITNEYFTTIDLTEQSLESQKQINEHFDKEIGDLDSQVKNFENITAGGNTGFNDIFTDIYSKIEALDKKIDEEVVKLEGEISDLESELETEKNKNNTQDSQIAQLQTSVNTLNQLVIGT